MSNMLYTLYDACELLLQPIQLGSDWLAERLREVALDARQPHLDELASEWEAFALSQISHVRPAFMIDSVADANGVVYPVEQSTVVSTPFADLIRFGKVTKLNEPRVLLVAPMSGHFCTLLAGTLKTLLQDHVVYLTDWLNPRDIPLMAGEFGFDQYVEHLIAFLRLIEAPAHIMAVCQPAVAALAATALMAEDKDESEPASVILLAGPVDVRISPTRVNHLANQHPIEWFEQRLITSVPLRYRGFGRRVYPGFLQLFAFMAMNPERHIAAFRQLKEHRRLGYHDRAEAIIVFYKEYFAVMDLPAEFYLETVERVFQQTLLPRRELEVLGRKVDCSAIRKPFLLTIEGERDDICGIGQTLGAQDLCDRMPMYKKTHLLQPGVGHYGVFNGKRWERRIYPMVRNFIQSIA